MKSPVYYSVNLTKSQIRLLLKALSCERSDIIDRKQLLSTAVQYEDTEFCSNADLSIFLQRLVG